MKSNFLLVAEMLGAKSGRDGKYTTSAAKITTQTAHSGGRQKSRITQAALHALSRTIIHANKSMPRVGISIVRLVYRIIQIY